MRHIARKIPRSLWIGLLVVSPAIAGPILHEKLASDPAEDLRFGATTPSGAMPAALQTRSGVVAAPEETLQSSAFGGNAYGGSQTPTSADASYYVDKLTTRPNRVQYDEPFRPSLLPFKRLYAFDSLRDDLSFSVHDKTLTRLSLGGRAGDSEDVFFADFEVDLVAGVPVRIPSVGPGARIRAMHADPPVPLQILKDGAENWFARAERGGRARVVMQISIERSTFGASFATVSWDQLSPRTPVLPDSVIDVAEEVLSRIDVNRGMEPARALGVLVEYFRSFRESSQLPVSETPVQLYKELSFEQKGVCRHRAYAFTVTALALGLPTRLVHNEAHAWVEVFDTEIWHRLDLGGAASNIQELSPDPLNPHHRPPRDPHAWPAGSRSALSVTSRSRGLSTPTGGQGSGAGLVGLGVNQGQAASGWPGAAKATISDSSVVGEKAEVVFQIEKSRLLRGRPLSLSGSARRGKRPCSLARIDIFIEGSMGSVGIGSLVTNRQGDFQGHVTLPQTTPLGSLQVSALVAGGCE